MAANGSDSEEPGPSLVIIEASIETAEAAYALGYHAIFVQSPGGPVQELLDDHALLHPVELDGKDFPDFVDRVLRPLAPAAAVALDGAGEDSADAVNGILGIPAAAAAEHRARLRATRGETEGRVPVMTDRLGEVRQ
ncbi:hypothetical protein AB0E77_11280 [Streptomyces sp. NPDC032940]|uniref:hypothetical protein n=1 Tax=Streptomyces sp. NPDC032940 TaxID=3155366 RepID=UPI0033D546A0